MQFCKILERVGGGLNSGVLKKNGDKVDANVWITETDNVFASMYNLIDRDFAGGLKKNIKELLDATIGKNEGKILFDVKVNIKISIAGDLVDDKMLALRGQVTEFELQLLMRNKSWFENVIFHDAGKVLNSEEIISKGIKYIE